jgi:LuxR family transcriptional regulator, maltose regulon positive regulatory protein
MARRIPLVTAEGLRVLEPPGGPRITVDSPGWAAWLRDPATRSFSFRGSSGIFTARKERRSGGAEYWSAYRKRGGKLRKVYLGKAEKVTLARLEDAATKLAGRGEGEVTTADDAGPTRADGAGREVLTRSDEHALESSHPGLQGDPLLLTKLSVPSARPSLVTRPRLSERLEQELGGKLTLISAPAGFGKTTLLSMWLAVSSRSGRSAVWLSLDPGDNDPTRFWRYFIAVADRLYPGAGDTALVLLHSSQAPPIEAILTTLLNELTELPADAVIVLDDYHLIESRTIHEALLFLIEHLPPQVHLVISTRADPPLPLSRLRARGEMAELRASDLRFTTEETTAFLEKTVGSRLSAEEVAELQERTEGWVAGLQLAALALRDRFDTSGFIAAFTGSNRYVVDYLVEEVLARQPEALRTFLLQTSILDRMCGPLCDAVTSMDDGQEALEYLEHANLFVIPLDEDRRWYRYHHLFTDVLRQRLRETNADLPPELHRRASVWFERQGLAAEAVHHALEAHDIERAAALIEDIGLSVMLPGQVFTLLGWLDKLSDAVVRWRPALCIVHAAALMFAGQPEAAETRLDDAERDVQADAPADQILILGQAASIRGNLARISGDLARCVAFSRQALDLLPETHFTWKVSKLNATYAYQVSGEATPTTERLVADAIATVRGTGNPLTILRSVINLAQLQVLQGRLQQAVTTFEEAARSSSGPGGSEQLVGNPAYYFGMGDLLREWNDLDAAEHHLEQGMDLVSEIPTVDAEVVAHGFISLAQLQQARGEYGAAKTTLENFSHLGRERKFFAPLLGHAGAAKARLALAQGNLPEAIAWVDANGLNIDEPRYPRELEYLTLARVLIARGRDDPEGPYFDHALRLIDRLLEAAESGARMGSAIEILILRALALHARRETSGAFVALGRALTLAEPEGYVRVFVDEGAPMAALLSEFLKARHIGGRSAKLLASLDYVLRLLVVFESPLTGAEPPASAQHPQATGQPLAEHLTTREREVLALIGEGFSNRGIAARLFIATSTVKWYVHSILRKLEVDSRTKAVARGRELHLTSE